MDFTEMISPELIGLVPVLYVFGMAFKRSGSVKDKHIPIMVGIMGIVLACCYMGLTVGFSAESMFTGLVQGILMASASVYSNQVYKQETKDE